MAATIRELRLDESQRRIRSSGISEPFGSASPIAMDMLQTAGLESEMPPTRLYGTPKGCGMPGGGRVAPNAANAVRKVLVSDEELLRRVQSVQVTTDLNNALANVSLHGWKWKCDKQAFSIFTKGLATAGGSGVDVADAQVLAMGTVSGGRALERLATLLRSPSESDFNSLMKGLFKREFIYGSLVHEVASPSTSACEGFGDDSLLTVRTCAFVRSQRFSHKKNEQMCFIEHFRPTKNGFAIVFTSLPQHELTAGKAKGNHVDQLCPMSGWLLVEKAPESKASVRALFHASLDPTFADPNGGAQNLSFGLCSVKTTVARLLRIAKGVCRLGEVLHQHRRMEETTRRNAEVSARPGDVVDFANSHCVACTSKLDFLRRRRRCGLCAYNACAKCCFREPMVIYNRYAATIQFCARCRECMVGGEYPHLRLAARRHSSPGTDIQLEAR
ncbi:hypothetical protein BBJ28_00016235 [Nothophytophthora sp. Chile5]|nr:hypothetical protein BBJ28_00016235 [Nothophytophthora sp. Chile5]